MTRPRHTAKRAAAELKAELDARRRDAAFFLKAAWERRRMRPGYVSADSRALVEELITDLEVGP